MGAARKNVSPWSLDLAGDVTMSSTTALRAISITPKQLDAILAYLERVGAFMGSITSVFQLIENHTTGYAVVHPLAEAGQKISVNLSEDIYTIHNLVREATGTLPEQQA
jgi:hypothetical protein